MFSAQRCHLLQGCQNKNMRGRVQNKAGFWIAPLAVLAFLFSAFSHDPLAPEPWSEAIKQAHYAAEYVLPDGTVPERCHDFHQGPGEHRQGACEACRIASFSWIPVIGLAEILDFKAANDGVWPPAKPIVLMRACYRLTGPSRAPPIVLI